MIYRINERVKRSRIDFKRWISKRQNQHKLTLIISGVVIASLFFGLVFSLDHSSQQHYQLIQKQERLSELHTRLLNVQKQKADTTSQLKEKQAQEALLRKRIDTLNKQLQAKAEAKRKQSLASRVINTVTGTQKAYAAPSGCAVWHSGNTTIDTLINRESGGRTCATNAGGCYGILQACPGYPLQVACGGDGACQLAWFTANKLGRYGTWDAALAHSYATGWW